MCKLASSCCVEVEFGSLGQRSPSYPALELEIVLPKRA